MMTESQAFHLLDSVAAEITEPDWPPLEALERLSSSPVAEPGAVADAGRSRRLVLVAAAAGAFVVAAAIVLAVARDEPPAVLDTTATTAAIPPLPRFIPAYLPGGMTAGEERQDPDPVGEPGWVTKWTRPNPEMTSTGVDGVTVEVATPGETGHELVFSPPDQSWATTPLGAMSSPRGLPHYPDGTPLYTGVNGRTAFVVTGVPALYAMNWRLDNGATVRVSANGLKFDEVLRVARAVTFTITPAGSSGGLRPAIDPLSLPPGFTFALDGRVDVTGAGPTGRTQQYQGPGQSTGFVIRSVRRRFDPTELRWSLAEPVNEVAGGDGLRFLVTGRPELSSPQTSLGVMNRLYGGRDDITIRVEGPLPVDELLRIALSLRETPDQPPLAPSQTTPADTRPSLVQGTVLFTKTSPDGRLQVTAKLIEPSEPNETCTTPFCNPSGRPVVFLEQRVEGRLRGGGGGGVPQAPSSPIEATGSGNGGFPPTQSISTVWFATAPNVAKVTMDLRQLDNQTVTDEMVPAHGMVIFLAPEPGDFIGDAKAYDANGNLLGTARPMGSTLTPR